MSTDYVIDDYIVFIESYVRYLGYVTNDGDTAEDCAQHVMGWCEQNNSDLYNIPLPEFERIIKLYYHHRNEV